MRCRCGRDVEFIFTPMVLTYPAGHVYSGGQMYYCKPHLADVMEQIIADEFARPYGFTVIRYHPSDKVAIEAERPAIEGTT